MTDHEFKTFVTRTSVTARTSFYHFCLLVNASRILPYPLVISRCHKFLIHLVQEVYNGTGGDRNSVSLPPQHGKSTFLSVLGTAWVMGMRPGLQVAITGFSHELVIDFSRQIQKIVTSAAYGLIFPGADSIDPELDRQDYWRMGNGSILRAKSVGKKLTGRRVDWLVIDDAHAGRAEAESTADRKRVKEWYFGDCVSRLAPGAKILMIGTRFHPEDLIGHVISDAYRESLEVAGMDEHLFQHWNLPAICVNPETDIIRREFGEPLFPEVRTTRFLNGLRAGGIANYEWESQYQGNPQSSRSGQVDTDKLIRIKQEDVPTDIPWMRGWDLAVTIKTASCNTAGALVAYDRYKDHLYIIDIWHGKLSWPKLKPLMIRKAIVEKDELNVQTIGMEAVAGFIVALDEIRRELLGKVRVIKRNPVSDKLLRAQPWLNKIEAGKVSMVKGEWNRAFMNELTLFPDGAEDDQIDAVSIAFEMHTKQAPLM